MKEEIFSKFKDYNNELEKILEKKDFSKDSKNLLLSMFYKLESSYEDYQTVKRRVKSKQEYLENILENIRQCLQIKIIKPNTEEFECFMKENKLYDVDLKLKKIKVIENETALLSAILELDNFRIYLNEEYNLVRNAFPYLLNTANDMNNTEVLRDFNAFSWNISAADIQDIGINLVYENLKALLSINIIEKIKNTNTTDDIIQLIKENMNSIYEEKVVNEFLNILFRISIIIYIKKSQEERKRLSEEYKVIQEELEFIKDKREYVNNIINKKLELSKKLKEIDLILNDKNLLAQEYEKRNESLSEYYKIFSLSHLTEKLQRERTRHLNRIEEYNKNLEPKNYVKNKQKLQNDFNLLKGIQFEDMIKNEKLLYKNIDKLQTLFLEKMLPQKIKKMNEKDELINFIYEMRYYYWIPYKGNIAIKDVEKFRMAFDNLTTVLLKKMYHLKIMNTISTSEKNDIMIVKNIFELNTVSLEDIYLELLKDKKDKNKYILNIYDDKDTLEEAKSIELEFNKKDKIKLKRKIKLF